MLYTFFSFIKSLRSVAQIVNELLVFERPNLKPTSPVLFSNTANMTPACHICQKCNCRNTTSSVSNVLGICKASWTLKLLTKSNKPSGSNCDGFVAGVAAMFSLKKT